MTCFFFFLFTDFLLFLRYAALDPAISPSVFGFSADRNASHKIYEQLHLITQITANVIFVSHSPSNFNRDSKTTKWTNAIKFVFLWLINNLEQVVNAKFVLLNCIFFVVSRVKSV